MQGHSGGGDSDAPHVRSVITKSVYDQDENGQEKRVNIRRVKCKSSSDVAFSVHGHAN